MIEKSEIDRVLIDSGGYISVIYNVTSFDITSKNEHSRKSIIYEILSLVLFISSVVTLYFVIYYSTSGYYYILSFILMIASIFLVKKSHDENGSHTRYGLRAKTPSGSTTLLWLGGDNSRLKMFDLINKIDLFCKCTNHKNVFLINENNSNLMLYK